MSTPPQAPDDDRSEEVIAGGLGLERATHHLLLCTGPRCCRALEGEESWSELRVKLAELQRKGKLLPQAIRVSRVSCLKICRSGPILLVYPDGTWYRHASPQVCARVLTQHVVGGAPLADHAFCNAPLGPGEEDPGEPLRS